MWEPSYLGVGCIWVLKKTHNGTLCLVVGTLLSRQWEPHIRLGIGTLLVCGHPVPGVCRNCTSIIFVWVGGAICGVGNPSYGGQEPLLGVS